MMFQDYLCNEICYTEGNEKYREPFAFYNFVLLFNCSLLVHTENEDMNLV